MNCITYHVEQIPVLEDFDICVCRGGVAVCATRENKKVLLIERYGAVGGMACGIDGIYLRNRLEDFGLFL